MRFDLRCKHCNGLTPALDTATIVVCKACSSSSNLLRRAALHKHTALALCEHHKRTCDGATCNISLYSIRLMAEEAGVEFTPEEAAMFV